MLDTASEIIQASAQGLITKEEARSLLGVDRLAPARDIEEAERVLRIISGWNPHRVSTAEAIQPAIDYFDAKAVPDRG